MIPVCENHNQECLGVGSNESNKRIQIMVLVTLYLSKRILKARLRTV